MNKLDAAIVLINNAKELVVNTDRNGDINWTGYQDNLRIARRLLSEMYVYKDDFNQYDREKQVAKELRGVTCV